MLIRLLQLWLVWAWRDMFPSGGQRPQRRLQERAVRGEKDGAHAGDLPRAVAGMMTAHLLWHGLNVRDC